MWLVVRAGEVVDTFSSDVALEAIQAVWPDSEIVDWSGPFERPAKFPVPDPRRQDAYRGRRQQVYPPLPDQLDMLYWDRVNGTTHWQDVIAGIKAAYPKPT